jgi:transposase
MPRPSTSKAPEAVQRFELSDVLWMRLEPLLPPVKAMGTNGRCPVPPRRIANAIFFVLRTGCQWKALGRSSFGCSGSSAHRYFQRWVKAGVFERFWEAGLQEYDEMKGIKWRWQSMDGGITKAPLGGAPLAQTRPTAPRLVPSDRCRLMPRGSRSAWLWTEPTATT